jgi:hypothetical protein
VQHGLRPVGVDPRLVYLGLLVLLPSLREHLTDPGHRVLARRGTENARTKRSRKIADAHGLGSLVGKQPHDLLIGLLLKRSRF